MATNGDDASSPGSLSSPPHSPPLDGVGLAPVSTPTPAAAAGSPAPRLTASGQPRKKPGPKPKPRDASATETAEKKVRKPRKQAEPKDPNAAPVRKRRTKASLEAQVVASPKIEDVKPQSPTPQPQPRPSDPVSVLQSEPPPPVVSQPPRVLSNHEITLHSNPNLSHISVAPSTPAPRPASSGQRYDPIRGGIIENKPQAPANVAPPPISPPLNRASASPSITSLIDPPSASNSFYTQPVKLQQQSSITSAPASPADFSTRPGSTLPSQDIPPQPQQHVSHQPHVPSQPHSQPPQQYPSILGPTPMDIDAEPSKSLSVPMAKSSSTHSGTPTHSNAPTPPAKPARQKEAPPPLPTGSGLLSGTAFGSVASGESKTENQGTNIYLTFVLKGQDNVTINFAQEVEKKYGFAALHPRIAARRERQRQITAAGAALEKAAGGGSNDDMSLDLSENESNVEMGGMEDETSARENGGKKRRKRKQEDYDKEDDFIDDTELAWEQQALMAKDGFFVYSGPLVTEEKPTVERADGTVRRGRGRGRGGAVRGETTGRGRGRGGGPGSRGGTTVRKPRVTKADRAQMEQEKQQRESMAANIASKQPLAAFAGPQNAS
ncbi:hypothetical protein NX059_003277 [Plenodomus lindquistii]|nr:hypothetical protein NX059_003277 [Plenodomus lindquistii]